MRAYFLSFSNTSPIVTRDLYQSHADVVVAPSPSGAVGLDTDAIIAICVGIASPVVSIGIALVTYYACVRPRRVVDDTGRESADRQRSGVSTPAPRAGSPDSDTETESIDRRRSKVSTLAPREGSLDSDSEMPQRPRSVHPSTVGLTRRRSMLLPRLSQDRSLSGYGDDATTCHPPVVDSHRDKPPCCS